MHGEKHEAHRLKKKLETYFGNSIQFESPPNWVTVEMRIKKEKRVKLYGEILDERFKIENQAIEDEKNVKKLLDVIVSEEESEGSIDKETGKKKPKKEKEDEEIVYPHKGVLIKKGFSNYLVKD